MRLKTTPEDFVVREATSLRIRRQPGPYRVYLLEKTGWNTADALMRIARAHRIPYRLFSYGGKKDRHAHTVQYVTVKDIRKDLSVTEKGYRFRALGWSTEPMTPGCILMNHFEVTLRELTAPEVERITGNLERVQQLGLPNYFDDQRFGSYDRERGFIAERMLQGNWEEALAIALTSPYPGEHKVARRRKRALRERWGDWASCRAIARTAFEQRSFDLLQQSPAAFREALATVHQEEAAMWVAAYQSYLWNEMVRRLLLLRGWGCTAVPGVAGEYLFATREAELEGWIIPLPGRRMRFEDPHSGDILVEILRERRLRPASLERELLPGLALHASPREVLLRPQGLHMEGPEPDERYPGHQKLRLRFTLPRGSYATMVVKALLHS